MEPSLRDLATYPFLPQARDYLRRLGMELQELADPAFSRVLDRAKERVVQALTKGRIDGYEEDPEVEVLAFHLALLLVRAMRMEHVASRYSLAEALRIERALQREREDFVLQLLRDVLGVKVERGEEEGPLGARYRLPLPDYLERVSQFNEKGWKLINRPVYGGMVFLRLEELIRLVREEVFRLIRSRLMEISPPKLPERLQEVVVDLVRRAPSPPRPLGDYPTSPKSYPPCVRRALDMLEKGENVPHYGRFLLATYLLNIGKGVEELLELFSHTPDYNERIARYQIEHIAGLKGSKIRYTCPSCQNAQAHNFCFKTEECEGITNPLQFGRRGWKEKEAGKGRRKVSKARAKKGVEAPGRG